MLMATLPEGKLAFKDKALDLGQVAVGTPQTSIVTLVNQGNLDAMFQVSASWFLRAKPCRSLVLSQILALHGGSVVF